MAERRRQAPEKQRLLAEVGARIGDAVSRWGAEHGARGVLAFSREAGLSDTALGEYIKGAQEPGVYALTRIAETSGVDLTALVLGDRHIVHKARPSDHVRALLGSLRSLAGVAELSRDHQRRYRDFVNYAGTQLRRLVFDTERLLAELHARSQDLRFDAEEWRRRWLDGEDDHD